MKPATVLVADDNFDSREIISAALISAGYRVVAVSNGREALDVVTKEAPNLVLADLSMPVMSGWELVARLRAMPELKKLPIVALTAHAFALDQAKAIQAGFDDYITKPYIPRDVLARVRSWLS